MYCANCGKQLRDDATYCVWCGMPVESFSEAESPGGMGSIGGAESFGEAETIPGVGPGPDMGPARFTPDPLYAEQPAAPVPEAAGGMAMAAESKRPMIIIVAVIVGAMAIAALLVWAFLGNYGHEEQDSGTAVTEETETSYDSGSTDDTYYDEGKVTADTGYSDDYISDSSDRYINESDVAGFSRNDLNYAINELYARHGAQFTDDDVIAYFNSKSWYSPTKSKEAARSEFTDIEDANFMFLCDYRDTRYPPQ